MLRDNSDFDFILTNLQPKVQQFEAIRQEFQSYEKSLHFLNQMDDFKQRNTMPSAQEIKSFVTNLSEWFVCYLVLQDEHMFLSTGKVILKKHNKSRSQYEDLDRTRSDQRKIYKNCLWLHSLSWDSLECVARRRNLTARQDAKYSTIQHLCTQIGAAIRDGFNLATKKISELVGSNSASICDVYPNESIKFRTPTLLCTLYSLKRGNQCLSFSMIRPNQVKRVLMSDLQVMLRRRGIIPRIDEDDEGLIMRRIKDIASSCSHSEIQDLVPDKIPSVFSVAAVLKENGYELSELAAHREAVESESRQRVNPSDAHDLVYPETYDQSTQLRYSPEDSNKNPLSNNTPTADYPSAVEKRGMGMGAGKLKPSLQIHSAAFSSGSRSASLSGVQNIRNISSGSINDPLQDINSSLPSQCSQLDAWKQVLADRDAHSSQLLHLTRTAFPLVVYTNSPDASDQAPISLTIMIASTIEGKGLKVAAGTVLQEAFNQLWLMRRAHIPVKIRLSSIGQWYRQGDVMDIIDRDMVRMEIRCSDKPEQIRILNEFEIFWAQGGLPSTQQIAPPFTFVVEFIQYVEYWCSVDRVGEPLFLHCMAALLATYMPLLGLIPFVMGCLKLAQKLIFTENYKPHLCVMDMAVTGEALSSFLFTCSVVRLSCCTIEKGESYNAIETICTAVMTGGCLPIEELCISHSPGFGLIANSADKVILSRFLTLLLKSSPCLKVLNFSHCHFRTADLAFLCVCLCDVLSSPTEGVAISARTTPLRIVLPGLRLNLSDMAQKLVTLVQGRNLGVDFDFEGFVIY